MKHETNTIFKLNYIFISLPIWMHGAVTLSASFCTLQPTTCRLIWKMQNHIRKAVVANFNNRVWDKTFQDMCPE